MKRYRIRFTKRDRLRFISHRDLVQVFERALRRADIDVAHTQGFNPRPKLVFGLALPLGVESLDEVVDVELAEPLSLNDLRQRLALALPAGIDVTSLEEHPQGRAFALVVEATHYTVELPDDLRVPTFEAIERYRLAEHPSIVRERPGGMRTIRLKDFVRSIEFEPPTLAIELAHFTTGGIKATEVLQWLGLDPLELKIVKTRTILAPP